MRPCSGKVYEETWAVWSSRTFEVDESFLRKNASLKPRLFVKASPSLTSGALANDGGVWVTCVVNITAKGRYEVYM
jgi:hypothetical protein